MIYNIPNHRRGDTWDGISSISLSANGVPLNLSGAEIAMQFRQSVDSPVAFEFTTSNNKILITNPLEGTFTIPPMIIDVPFQTYYYDLQITFASGRKKTYMEGYWKIIPDITY